MLLLTENQTLLRIEKASLVEELEQCSIVNTIIDEVRGYTILQPSQNVKEMITKSVGNIECFAEKNPDRLEWQVYWFEFNQGDFFPPQPIGTIQSGHPTQVLFICGSPGLRLFFQNADKELLPLLTFETISAGGVVDLQAMGNSIYFSYTPHAENCDFLILIKAVGSSKLSGPSFLQFSEPIEDLLDKFIEQSYITIPTDRVSLTFYEYIQTLLPNWFNRMGPMDYRNYEGWYPLDDTLKIDDSLREFFTSLTGTQTLSSLTSVTGLKLGAIIYWEIMKIGPQSYRIFNDKYSEPYGLDLILSIPINNGKSGEGTWKYLVDGEEVFSIDPLNNPLTLVYRIPGCDRFLPYVPIESSLNVIQLHVVFSVLDHE